MPLISFLPTRFAHTQLSWTPRPTPGSVSFDATILTVNVGTLAFDTTAMATLIVRVDHDTPLGTIIGNTVNGSSDTPDPETSNNSATAFTALTGPFPGDVLISEFRLSGPGGDDDPSNFVNIELLTDQLRGGELLHRAATPVK